MKNLLTRRYTLPLFCLLCSFAVLAVCSRSSPLYATNDWVDANIYFTIGRGMHQGLMPYRDLLDHKGPLLYLLHWAAAAVSSTSFFGVWLLEVLAGWAFLYASARTLLLYCGRGWTFFSLPLLAACVYASPAFAQGDSAEEFCLPLLAIALYFFLAYFGPGKQLPSFWVFALNGAAAGAIFWIKFTLLGLHFAWMACFAFLIWIGHRSFGRALAACGAFLGGMAVISVPILLPYALGGALPDLFQTYFGANLTSYAITPTHWSTPLYNLVMSGLSTALANPVWAVLALVGGVFFVLRRGVLHPAAKAALLALVFFSGFFIWAGSMGWPYYGFPLSVYAVLGFACLGSLVQKLPARLPRGVVQIGFVPALALSLALCLAFSPNVSFMELKKEDLVQTKFAAIIQQEGGQSLLNYGFLDGGFYLSSGITPSCRFFCRINLPNYQELEAPVRQMVEEGYFDFIVTREEGPLPGMEEHYELVCTEYQTYDGVLLPYSLFRRIG